MLRSHRFWRIRRVDFAFTVAPAGAALRDPNRHVRQFAAMALGNIGPEARDAVPSLINCLSDDDEYLKRAACESLGKIAARRQLVLPALYVVTNDLVGDNRGAPRPGRAMINPSGWQITGESRKFSPSSCPGFRSSVPRG